MGFFGDFFFGKRDRTPIVVNIPHNVYNGIETLVYIHNSKHNPIDHITIDDVASYALERVVRSTLRIMVEKPPEPPIVIDPPKSKKQNIAPVFYVEDRPRGRSQYTSPAMDD